MRRLPALSLLPALFLCALLCAGCQSAPENAIPYSEEAVYTFLEDAVLSGEPSVTGYFTGDGAASDPAVLDALLTAFCTTMSLNTAGQTARQAPPASG